ncbi:MAG: glutathione S-transferase [Zetaproteobacteria bacterium]|mgnify:CR=1 FL=1|nr:glutathione S-transferase [Pseudobdellovibrionaceae bacterium]
MKLYGFANSRSFRTLWLLEEVGAQYELKMLSPPDFNSDWFLEINPNGKVPALVDGDLKLFESAAICNHIARKFPEKELIPQATNELSIYDQWMFFVMSELEQPLWTMAKHKFALPKTYRQPDMKETALFEWNKALKALDAGLNTSYLVGESFTAVDIMAAQTLQWAERFKVPIESKKILDYKDRVVSRESFQQASDKFA